MLKTLKIGDTAMVKMVNAKRTAIKNNKIIPVIYTAMGLILYTEAALIHINVEECVHINMPLQCVLD